MSQLHEAMNTTATTNNGAVTNYSSLNKCVDLFFMVGSARNMDIIPPFTAAFGENPEIALKIMLWARDVREGAGERKTFRDILRHLSNKELLTREKLHNLIYRAPEVGRWDDLLCLVDDENTNELIRQATLSVIAHELKSNNLSLCAKWMPRKGPIAAKLKAHMKLSPKAYRKLLVAKSNTVEQLICANKWEKVEYGKLPSIAAKQYANAFRRHDEDRYTKYLEDLAEGKEKVNAGAIFPHDVIMGLKHGQVSLANQQWKALPDYLEGTNERVLPVVDVSGSMNSYVGGSKTSLCIDVSIALGLYLSERNKGVFHNEFITFSETPMLQKLTGDTLQLKYEQLHNAPWGNNTNIRKVFEVILSQAINYGVPDSEMPTTIVILSDMEFDSCGPNTNFNAIKKLYEKYKYEMPKLVFWNLNARPGNVPATINDKGVALVSGFSPAIMKSTLRGEILSPVQIMLAAVDKERYTI